MDKSSISIYFVNSALEPARARGLDIGALLRQAGIAPVLLLLPQSRVTAQSFSTLLLGVTRLIDDELFGQDERRMKVGSFAMLGHILIHCNTLREALQHMARYFNLILDNFHCGVECDARHARLTIAPASDVRAPSAFGYEALLAMQYGLACWLTGRRIAVLAAAFAYSEPPRGAEYARIYSENLRFNEAETALTFDHSYLDLPVIQNQQTLKEFLRLAPGNIVLKYKNSRGLTARIRQDLRTAVPAEWPDFNAFASKVGMTPSTLRRRLDDEGQSFQAIKDHLRCDLAINYLCHTDKSMIDISVELGFLDASSFHRAFKKWTGTCPGAYRQRMQEH